jgi:hypothetical protein
LWSTAGKKFVLKKSREEVYVRQTIDVPDAKVDRLAFVSLLVAQRIGDPRVWKTRVLGGILDMLVLLRLSDVITYELR